jgi:hypothetical protein
LDGACEPLLLRGAGRLPVTNPDFVAVFRTNSGFDTCAVHKSESRYRLVAKPSGFATQEVPNPELYASSTDGTRVGDAGGPRLRCLAECPATVT